MKDSPLVKHSSTDWERINTMDDNDIDYSDIPPLREEFFTNAVWWKPVEKKTVTVRLDEDLLEWLKSSGKGYQTRLNKLLRVVMEHQKKAA